MSRRRFPLTPKNLIPSATAAAQKPPAPHRSFADVVDHCCIFIDGIRMPGELKQHAGALETLHNYLAEAKQDGGHPHGFVWLSLNAPNANHMHAVADSFNVHDLIIDDIVAAHQRPKVETYDDQIFMVLKSVKYSDFDNRQDSVQQSRQVIEVGEVQMVLGQHFIITIRHKTPLPDLKSCITITDNEPATKQGPLGLAWAIADALVDDYRRAANELSEDVDVLEEEVFTPQSELNVDQIYLLKREVLEMRHAINPLEPALSTFNQLLKNRKEGEELRSYFRDVLDHEIVAKDSVNSSNERLTALIDAAVAKISLQQNADMRAISAYVGMAAVPTLVAGIYGMNFQNMPELAWKYGYFGAIGLMVAIVIVLWWAFKRRNWL